MVEKRFGVGLPDGEAKAGLEDVILSGDVMAEMAKPLLDPAAVHPVTPAKRGVRIAASLSDGPEDMGHFCFA